MFLNIRYKYKNSMSSYKGITKEIKIKDFNLYFMEEVLNKKPSYKGTFTKKELQNVIDTIKGSEVIPQIIDEYWYNRINISNLKFALETIVSDKIEDSYEYFLTEL